MDSDKENKGPVDLDEAHDDWVREQQGDLSDSESVNKKMLTMENLSETANALWGSGKRSNTTPTVGLVHDDSSISSSESDTTMSKDDKVINSTFLYPEDKQGELLCVEIESLDSQSEPESVPDIRETDESSTTLSVKSESSEVPPMDKVLERFKAISSESNLNSETSPTIELENDKGSRSISSTESSTEEIVDRREESENVDRTSDVNLTIGSLEYSSDEDDSQLNSKLPNSNPQLESEPEPVTVSNTNLPETTEFVRAVRYLSTKSRLRVEEYGDSERMMNSGGQTREMRKKRLKSVGNRIKR